MRHGWMALVAAMMMAACAHAAPEPAQPGTLVEHELVSGGAERSYLVYRPGSVRGPAPLVIVLHGGGGNAEHGMKMASLNALALREGFVAVYPNGSGRRRFLTWNAGHCCQYAMQQEVDDVGFISDLIDELVASGVADPDRVHVTGMSNGAMMAFRVGRELSHKVAAIAPVVGAMFGDEPPAASPVATLIITGAQDQRVPAAGGNGVTGRRGGPPNDRPFAPAGQALAYWMESNDCSGEARPISTAVYTLRQGTGCAAPTLWYSLPQGGHAWPGGRKGSPRGDEPVQDFDASAVIWEFFSAQELRR